MRDFIPVAEPWLGEKELAYATECVRTSWISSIGAFVSRFEEEFARFCGTKFAVSTSNGTTALHLALRILDIGEGDEVIVPSLTFASSAFAVSYTGAVPVFAEVDQATWNIDPTLIEGRISSRTKAIMLVHLYGHPVDIDPFLEIAHERNLKVIEDAAEAHGARYKGRRVGGLADVGCFSFYGNKIITTGEGGMLTLNSEALAEKARFFRDVAMSPDKRYWHTDIGYNYRLTNLQAAIGVAQLEKIEEIIGKKRRNAEAYRTLLTDVEGITLSPEASWAESVFWMYSVLIEDDFGMDRDSVMEALSKKGIDTRPFFYPLHTLPPYKTGERFPVAEDLASRGINLPSGVTLSEEEIGYIVNSLRSLKK